MLLPAQLVALALQFLPATNEALGPDVRIGERGALAIEARDDLIDACLSGKIGQGALDVWVMRPGGSQQRQRSRLRLVQALPGGVHLPALRFGDRKAFPIKPVDLAKRPRVTIDCLLEGREGTRPRQVATGRPKTVL